MASSATANDPTPSTSSHAASSNLTSGQGTPLGSTPKSKNPSRTSKHSRALQSIRYFLRKTSSYDILPESFRLIVLDNQLTIKRALVALVTTGVVSAPLYDSRNFRFAGMFTLTDVIHLIQYYYMQQAGYEGAATDVENFLLARLREIEQAIDVPPPPTLWCNPDRPLYEACAELVRTHARRLPLIDQDDATGRETILSVLTQYRVLKFISINCAQDCSRLNQSIGSLGIGTYISSYQPTPSGASTTTAGSIPPTTPLPRNVAHTSLPDTPSSRKSDEAHGHDEPQRHEKPKRPPLGGPRDSEATLKAQLTFSSSKDEEADGEDEDGEGETRETLNHLSREDAETEPRALSKDIDQDQPSSSSAEAQTSKRPSNVFSDANQSNSNVPHPSSSSTPLDPFHPVAVATLDTPVFDVVHLFSERGISCVPVVDSRGVVINLYETVDVVDLVRSSQFDVLDLTVGAALNKRAKDFPGVTVCSPEDSLGAIMALIREQRVHRVVIVESGDDEDEEGWEGLQSSNAPAPAAVGREVDDAKVDQQKEEEKAAAASIAAATISTDPAMADPNPSASLPSNVRPKAKTGRLQGRLVGILSLSDILRHIVGQENLTGHNIVGLGFGNGGEERSTVAPTASVAAHALAGGVGGGMGSGSTVGTPVIGQGTGSAGISRENLAAGGGPITNAVEG